MAVFKNDRLRAQTLSSYDAILEQWGTAFESLEIPTAYGTTHCLVAGDPDKPPLLLFHGVGDNSAIMWALNMSTLARHFHCIAIDTLGGPGRSVPNDQFTRASFRLVPWLDELVDRLGLAKPHLAGVSNGAHLAYQYLLARPDRVGRVVCMEGGIVRQPLRSMLRTMLLMFPEMLMPTDRQLRKAIRKLSSPRSDIWDRQPLLEQHLLLLMRSHRRAAMLPHRPQLYDGAADRQVRDRLLFLVGDHPAVVGSDYTALLAREGYQHAVIAGAGHAINHEQPEQVHTATMRFLLGDAAAES